VSTIPGDLVTMTENGWQPKQGWTVLRRIDNPMGYQPPKDSIAVAVTNGTRCEWVLARYDGERTEATPGPAGSSGFADWVAAEVRYELRQDGTTDESHAPAPVSFGEGETLVAADGVTILDQLPHPDLPRNFAGPNDRSAAAWINDSGEKSFVLVRETYGEQQVIPYKRDFDSLEAFVDFARQKYESEVGLL
jgi:hypothetical protein